MKIEKVSLIALSLLLGLSSLNAVPTDPINSETDLPTTPINRPLPTPPSPPPARSDDSNFLTLDKSGSTINCSLSSDKPYIQIALPFNENISWCFVQNVPADIGFALLSYGSNVQPVKDPDDDSKLVYEEISLWRFAPKVVGPITLSFYARSFYGELFPDPLNQPYTFTINVTK